MTITQAQAVRPDRIAAGDWTRFWRASRYFGLECLSAHLVTHAYAPHRHDTYVVGVLEAGVEAFTYRGRSWRATPGLVCALNPDELHDGVPEGPNGYRYRMVYPPTDLMADIAADLWPGRSDGLGGLPFFPAPLIDDPALAATLLALHRGLEAGADPLVSDQRLTQALTRLILRHADARPAIPATPHHPVGIARALARIDGEFDHPLDLAQLAETAGLSRFHFLRLFRRATGQTPHAYLLDRRVAAARRALRRGVPPAEVAGATGFADQAHLTRCFKARYAVTPGRFQRAADATAEGQAAIAAGAA